MNTNNEKQDNPINSAITEVLQKIKKEPTKEGVDLLDIAKKLSEKKFGKNKR
jgi:hypothetical protein